jgi:hypothetical protein
MRGPKLLDRFAALSLRRQMNKGRTFSFSALTEEPAGLFRAPAGNSSNRQNVVRRCRNCHLPTKDVEKHPDASGIVQLIQYRELLGEWARHQTHRRA